MYTAYTEFMVKNRISPVKKEAFGRSLSKLFKWEADSERIGDKIYRVWVNKRLTPEFEKIAQDAIVKIRQVYCQETLDKVHNMEIPSFDTE